MPMREDCLHYSTRTYDDGEVARYCNLDLAPEAPWRCPENCPSYERLLIDVDFEGGSLAHPPAVEDEPDGPTDEIVDVLADAESIVNEAAPEVVAELEAAQAPQSWWRRLRRRRPGPGGDDDFRLSNR